ncbi:unnamed protein product [Paramecium sonneborni]|uniref:Uncharacterized protein n=1 Tax=Paramecium sonneborni TaxID=65129 RepID=A0A8S1MB66_9CILI|nr:unnamed protein product [Paramecium sonneborni]
MKIKITRQIMKEPPKLQIMFKYEKLNSKNSRKNIVKLKKIGFYIYRIGFITEKAKGTVQFWSLIQCSILQVRISTYQQCMLVQYPNIFPYPQLSILK